MTGFRWFLEKVCRKFTLKFQRWEEGLSLYCLNRGLSRMYRIARILGFRVFNVFGMALGFTWGLAAIVGVLTPMVFCVHGFTFLRNAANFSASCFKT